MGEQKDLEGKRVQTDVTKEERTNVTLIFWHGHFMLKISAGALEKVQDMDDPAARRKKLAKKVIARPDAEVTRRPQPGKIAVAGHVHEPSGLARGHDAAGQAGPPHEILHRGRTVTREVADGELLECRFTGDGLGLRHPLLE